MRILLLEDDPRIADFLKRGLDEEGHHVVLASSAREAAILHQAQAFELALVDRGLPDGDGLDFIVALRAANDATPCICLTAKDTTADKVHGLFAGADDYLVKPFAFDELIARIVAVSRRSRTEPATTCEVGPLTLNTDALRAYCGDKELDLTALEFKLLRYLVERTGRICTRTRLLASVWEQTHDPKTNIVDVYIGYLRHKLAIVGAPPLIHTVRGRGYLCELRPRCKSA